MGHVSSLLGGSGGASLFHGASNVHIAGGTVVVARAGDNVHVTTLPAITDKATLDLVLAMLPPNKFRMIQTDNIQKRAPGSGIWFIESDVFQDWLHGRSTGKILWVTGNAGAGKTVLAAIVIAELQKLERPSSHFEVGTALAYVYCRYTDSMSVADLLLALVRQQLERNHSLCPLIETVLDKHKRENSKPSQEELLELLKVISQHFGTTYYVIDALDEAPHDVRFNIVQALASVDARFFITSRPLGHLEHHFAEFATFITVMAQKSDVELLVDNAIAQDPALAALVRQHDVREEVGNTIYRNCGGMFLHAVLQLRALQYCTHIDDLRDTLNVFPPEIDGFYTECFERLNRQHPKHVQLAKTTLSCILHAKRDLTLEELQRIISFDMETQQFKSITSADHLLPLLCGLVTLDAQSGLVRLVHYTAMDTVKRHLQGDALCDDPHALLASACIAHMEEHGFQHFDIARGDKVDAFMRNPFHRYAHTYWSFHAHKSSSPSVRTLCADFILKCESFPTQIEAKGRADGLGAIHVAVFHNFLDQVVRFTNLQSAVASTTLVCGLTPLHLAALQGHVKVAQALLACPGTPVNQADWNGYTPLMVAIRQGNEAIVRLLLDLDYTAVNLTNDNGNSALALAASQGLETIAHLLLNADGIAVDLKNHHGHSAFKLAAQRGHEAIIRLFLDVEGTAVNEVGSDRDSALIVAARGGHVSIVRLLLNVTGIMINTAGKFGESALICAPSQGFDAIVGLLLNVEGIAVNQVDQNGDSALTLAARGGYDSVVRLLLDAKDIAVNQKNRYGDSALLFAVRRGHEPVVRLLLAAEGIALHQMDKHGDSVLAIAVRRGHKSIVQLLLSHPHIRIFRPARLPPISCPPRVV